jgi:hypothetical protein
MWGKGSARLNASALSGVFVFLAALRMFAFLTSFRYANEVHERCPRCLRVAEVRMHVAARSSLRSGTCLKASRKRSFRPAPDRVGGEESPPRMHGNGIVPRTSSCGTTLKRAGSEASDQPTHVGTVYLLSVLYPRRRCLPTVFPKLPSRSMRLCWGSSDTAGYQVRGTSDARIALTNSLTRVKL